MSTYIFFADVLNCRCDVCTVRYEASSWPPPPSPPPFSKTINQTSHIAISHIKSINNNSMYVVNMKSFEERAVMEKSLIKESSH